MGRRPDPELRKRRLEALRLEVEEGLTAPKIALRFGVSVDTVRRWLRAVRGPKPPQSVREEAYALLDAGKTSAQVAAELSVTEDHVARLNRERRGFVRPWIPAKDRVPVWLKDPKAHFEKKWTRSENFGWSLLFECKTQVDRDPMRSEMAVASAIDLFATLQDIRRPGSTAYRVTVCLLVQALGIQAARERALAAPDKALDTIAFAREVSEGCGACIADLDRRKAIVLEGMGRYNDALRCLESAGRYYQADAIGHDLDSHGYSSCTLTKAYILMDSGSPTVALIECEDALKTVPRQSDTYFALWYALAKALMLISDLSAIERAKHICQNHLRSLGAEPGLQRARLCWLNAKLSEIEGDVDAAILQLEDAFEDVRAMKYSAGMAAIAADLGRLSPGSLGERIEDFKDEWDDDLRRKVLPAWLEHLDELLKRVIRMAASDVWRAVHTLRVEGNGDAFMPQIAVA